MKLRKREKKHYLKVQEIHDDEESKAFRTSKGDVDKFLNDDSEMNVDGSAHGQEQEELGYTQRTKSKEI